jgi:hypothetical protein
MSPEEKRFLILLNFVKRVAADKKHYLCICKDVCYLAEQVMLKIAPTDEEIEKSYAVMEEL